MIDYKHLMAEHDARIERFRDYRLRVIQVALMLALMAFLWR